MTPRNKLSKMKTYPIPHNNLPPLPKGKTQWVGRGYPEYCEDVSDRVFYYWFHEWKPTAEFCGNLFHIEAI